MNNEKPIVSYLSAGIPRAEVGRDETARVYPELTNERIEEIHQNVLESGNYGKEGRIIHDVLNRWPQNDDFNTIAMKISVIDVTNSTNLARYKSKLSLYDLAMAILAIPDFDERVKAGDPELVNLIARNNGSINLFSFASKYCTYHNAEIYGRDDYSIYDGVVRETLPHYWEGLKEKHINRWRKEYNYGAFKACIDEILDAGNITVQNRRRKFDHFLWYANR